MRHHEQTNWEVSVSLFRLRSFWKKECDKQKLPAAMFANKLKTPSVVMRGDGACITGRGCWAGENISDGMVTRLEISRFCQAVWERCSLCEANSDYRVMLNRRAAVLTVVKVASLRITIKPRGKAGLLKVSEYSTKCNIHWSLRRRKHRKEAEQQFKQHSVAH